MSMTVGQYGLSGANSILNQAVSNMEAEQAKLAWQSSKGTISQDLAGLGANLQPTLNLSPKVDEISGYQDNISSALSRLKMSSDSLTQMVTIAQNLSSQVLSMLSTTGSTTTQTLAASQSAQDGLASFGTILNTTDGNGYIFAGQDNNTPPVTSPSSVASGPLATQIQSIVSNLNGSNATDIYQQATKAASDNSPGVSIFSRGMSVSPQDAQNKSNQVVIGSNGRSVSSGPTATSGSGLPTVLSTGSPIRDVMRDMMILSSVKGMSSSTPGFYDLMQQLHQSLERATNKIIDMNSSIGVTQQSLNRQKGAYTSLTLMVKSQLSNNLDADMASVATQSNDLNIRLKASFMLIANSKDLSLANYI